MKASLPERRPAVRFGESAAEEKGVLDTAKSWLKLLLPTTLAATALYQNGNIIKYLWGLDSTISKFIADNAPKALSPTQWLWQNTKSFCISAIATLPGAYFFGADSKKIKAIYDATSQVAIVSFVREALDNPLNEVRD